jgi:hypothetical protein
MQADLSLPGFCTLPSGRSAESVHEISSPPDVAIPARELFISSILLFLNRFIKFGLLT